MQGRYFAASAHNKIALVAEYDVKQMLRNIAEPQPVLLESDVLSCDWVLGGLARGCNDRT